MNLLFCDNPFEDKPGVDPDYMEELLSAQQNGFTVHLFSFELLVNQSDVAGALKRIKTADTLQDIIYRGWMLKPVQYAVLYESLLSRNYKLINSPTEYQNCHYLPDSYPFIADLTPRTTWLKVDNLQPDYEEIFRQIELFGASPLIIKDYVKSQKHYWDSACFIPSAADKSKARSVIDKFIALQNTDLNEGLVIREFVALNDLTIHTKSGMPLKQEYRLFFCRGNLLGCYDYWEEGDYLAVEKPPLDDFREVSQKIESHFFSMDVAKTKAGQWVIIELGDGQVAGLPEKADMVQFYAALHNAISVTR